MAGHFAFGGQINNPRQVLTDVLEDRF